MKMANMSMKITFRVLQMGKTSFISFLLNHLQTCCKPAGGPRHIMYVSINTDPLTKSSGGICVCAFTSLCENMQEQI